MKFIELYSVAKSLVDYVGDFQLVVINKKTCIKFVKNSENWTNLNDWLIDLDIENVKVEYNSDYVKLSLS